MTKTNQKQEKIKVDIQTTTQIYTAAKYITNTIKTAGWEELKESSPEYKKTMKRIHSHLQLILMTFETLDEDQQQYIIKNILKDGDVESLKMFLNDPNVNEKNLMNRVESFNNFVSGHIVEEFHIPVEAVTMELSAWGQLVMKHYGADIFENKSIKEQVSFINSVCPFASPLNYNESSGTVSMNTMKAGFPDVVIVDSNGVLHGEAATSAPLSDTGFESDQQERHHGVLIFINKELEKDLKEYAQLIGKEELEIERKDFKKHTIIENKMEPFYGKYLGSKSSTDETIVENQRKLVSEMTSDPTYEDTKVTFSFGPAISNVIGKKKVSMLSKALSIDVNTLIDDFANILTYSQRFFNKGDYGLDFTKKFAAKSLVYSHKSITDGVNSSYIRLDIDKLSNDLKPIIQELNDISPDSDKGKIISSYFNSNAQTRMLFHSFFLLDPTFNSDKWEVSMPEKSRSLIKSNLDLIKSNLEKDSLEEQKKALRWAFKNRPDLENADDEKIVEEYRKSLSNHPPLEVEKNIPKKNDVSAGEGAQLLDHVDEATQDPQVSKADKKKLSSNSRRSR